MIRPALVVILLAFAVFMMRGVATDWRKGGLDAPEPPAKKAATSEAAPAVAPAKPLQPKAPPKLPDLKVGYIFNQERMLGGDESPPVAQANEEEADNQNAQGISASIDEITFVGSIIADGFTRALVLYPAASDTRAGQSAPKASKASKGKAPSPPGGGAPAAGGPEEHARLELGDKISGYEVAEILPDKLIFSKGDETVEKLLFDPAKKRQAPPMRPGSGPPGGGPPRPPTPGGVLSTTIGGAGPPGNPAAAGNAPPAPPVPANPAVPPTPPPSPPVQQTQHAPPPATSASPATQGGAPQEPVRRMVISRQSSPAPDTSRVVRQGKEGDEAVSMPPGVEVAPVPGDAAPPVPPDSSGN